MPGPDDAVRIYHGAKGGEAKSQLLHLLEADENLPFNGTGTMRPAFTTKSERRWQENLEKLNADEQKALLAQREGERLALVDWLKRGAPKAAYDADEFELSTPVVISDEFVIGEKDMDGKAAKVRVTSILTERCVRCHQESGADKHAEKYPLDEWSKLERYLKVDEGHPPMDIKKLAQTTHVHLIGFTMMFCATGVIFSLTNWPAALRVVLAPWPMFFQVIDISCWWLGRYEPLAAQAIVVTGGLVALGFALQILGSLIDLLGLTGRRSA
jgi:hypothetical protein